MILIALLQERDTGSGARRPPPPPAAWTPAGPPGAHRLDELVQVATEEEDRAAGPAGAAGPATAVGPV